MVEPLPLGSRKLVETGGMLALELSLTAVNGAG